MNTLYHGSECTCHECRDVEDYSRSPAPRWYHVLVLVVVFLVILLAGGAP